jgi:hypothetical protein
MYFFSTFYYNEVGDLKNSHGNIIKFSKCKTFNSYVNKKENKTIAYIKAFFIITNILIFEKKKDK